jgi:hypothetical protein
MALFRVPSGNGKLTSGGFLFRRQKGHLNATILDSIFHFRVLARSRVVLSPLPHQVFHIRRPNSIISTHSSSLLWPIFPSSSTFHLFAEVREPPSLFLQRLKRCRAPGSAPRTSWKDLRALYLAESWFHHRPSSDEQAH